MLFNSIEFLFLFLPFAVVSYFLFRRFGARYLPVTVLLISSLLFYAFGDLDFLPLLIASILFNFFMGKWIVWARNLTNSVQTLLFTVGVIVNLLPLAWFKYSAFVGETLSSAPTDAPLEALILPLGISFYTFQQIAFLLDVKRGGDAHSSFVEYASFVSFFPQLIAGPIVHARDMLPQFRRLADSKCFRLGLAVGLSYFAVGLIKKVGIADSLAPEVNEVFAAAAAGQEIDALAAWKATFGYTFQLYFDFSGYSDMAVGLAALFGISLPVNFYSPYRARSITQFWRSWHITLSVFLRDHVYIPLGGNRKGLSRLYLALFATMLLGGLWHGAGWTFVLWGGVHGGLLVIHRLWSASSLGRTIPIPFWLAVLITFLAVSIAWIPFRAESFTATLSILEGLVFMNGIVLPAQAIAILQLETGSFLQSSVYLSARDTLWYGSMLLGCATLCWFAPNTHELFGRYAPGFLLYDLNRLSKCHLLNRVSRLQWAPNSMVGATVGGIFIVGVLFILSGKSEFLYYQF